MTYTMTKNPEFNSVELSFPDKPSEAVREALKSLKFRWHKVRRLWYGYAEPEAVRAILDKEPEETRQETKKATAEPQELNGVHVGDLFVCSWGYDQTNIDFIQVVKICGTKSVRVQAVNPEIIKTDDVCGMAEDRIYKNTREPQPVDDRSAFIKNHETGDLHRVDFSSDVPTIWIRGEIFRLYHGQKLYCSWYA